MICILYGGGRRVNYALYTVVYVVDAINILQVYSSRKSYMYTFLALPFSEIPFFVLLKIVAYIILGRRRRRRVREARRLLSQPTIQ
mgnify:CR=1 FL=1